MAKKIIKEDLGYLGKEAQYQIVKALIEEPNLMATINTYLAQNAFTADKLRYIVGTMKDYFEKKGIPPTYKDLELIFLDRAKNEIEKEEYIASLNELKKETLLVGMETAKNIAIQYFKQQEAVKTLKKGIENIGDNGYTKDSLTEVIESIRKIDLDRDIDMGTNPMDIFDRVVEQDSGIYIPTGIPEIDEKMLGGLEKGKVGLLVAGTGIGKSTMTSYFANSAAASGYKVLQIFFEDDLEDIARKHYAKMSGLNTNMFYTGRLSKQEMAAAIKRDMEAYTNICHNLKLKRMVNLSTSVEDIKNYVRNLIAVEGFKPDMIVIDYLSCLKQTSNAMLNECQAGERCMKKIEAFAAEFDCAIWVAQQTNRNGMVMNTASERYGNIQGSFRITQPASAIIFLVRSPEQVMTNHANIYLDKNRGNGTGSWEDVYFNNGTLGINLAVANNNDADKIYE